MQRYPFYLVFVLLVTLSVLLSIDSYHSTRQDITADMDQALELTLAHQQQLEITPDTIRTFNHYLQTAELRGQATLSVANNEQQFRLQAHCPALTVWHMSDQRASMSLGATALLWALGCWFYLRRRVVTDGHTVRLGTLTYVPQSGVFLAGDQHPIHLTPMQHQLLRLFLDAPQHELSKQQICDALWPKKPDASDTLYTLIRRLKPIVEAHTNLHIDCERGRSYRLTT